MKRVSSWAFSWSALKSVEFLGLVTFVFSVVFPPFDDVAEVDLSTHMLQHIIIVLSGIAIAYPLYRRGTIPAVTNRWVPRVVLLASAALIAYWHLPGPWDSAVLNPVVHAAEHFSFLLIGMAIGSVLQALSDSAKIGALLAAFFGHMAYAVVLVAPWSLQVYALYSISDQATLGWALLLTGWTFLIGVAYVLTKNPNWLEGLSGTRQAHLPRPSAGANPRPRLGLVSLTASMTLVFVLVGYFAVTGAAVYGAPRSPPSGGATVYIVETPVSWQYSPQNIRVILGVNNTVTWISHSTSYDTVTEDSGVFASGVIAPGGTFVYEFTHPGVYSYRCVFHPWMVGTVTVLPNTK